MKIVAEDKAVESRTNDFLVDWEKAKPVDGDLRPHEALQKLAILSHNFNCSKLWKMTHHDIGSNISIFNQY